MEIIPWETFTRPPTGNTHTHTHTTGLVPCQRGSKRRDFKDRRRRHDNSINNIYSVHDVGMWTNKYIKRRKLLERQHIRHRSEILYRSNEAIKQPTKFIVCNFLFFFLLHGTRKKEEKKKRRGY